MQSTKKKQNMYKLEVNATGMSMLKNSLNFSKLGKTLCNPKLNAFCHY